MTTLANWRNTDIQDLALWQDEQGTWAGEVSQMRNCGVLVPRDYRARLTYKAVKGSLRVDVERQCRTMERGRELVAKMISAVTGTLQAGVFQT